MEFVLEKSLPFFYLFVAIGVFALGDVLGVKSKAKISSVFVAMLLFLVGFMTDILPGDIISQAGLTEIGRWSTGMFLFHMGTLIDWKEIIREWRVVLTSLIAMLAAMGGILLISPLIGRSEALVSIPIINGGLIATQIMTDAARTNGLELVAGLGAMIYAIQKLVGTPPASFFGLREAKRILKEHNEGSLVLEKREEAVAKEEKPSFAEKYNHYFTDFVCIAISALFGFIARFLGFLTPISYSIYGLFLGATVGYFKLVPKGILTKGGSSGILSCTVFASVIPSLAGIAFADLATLTVQLVILFGVTMASLFIVLYLTPAWKLVGSRDFSLGIGMAQLLGFPATYLVANEIATAVTDNDEEKKIVLDRIMPGYVIAGFVTVTTISIVIAGIFESIL